MVLGPSVRIMLRSDSSKPRISEVMPTIEVMPITTPRIVSAERSLLPRSVSIAIRQISPIRPLFTTQCLDGIESSGACRRVGPEEQADAGSDADAEHHGPPFQARRERAESRDGLCRDEAES